METFKLYIWGFETEDQAELPDDLELIDVGDTWPTDAPVVIHARAWKAFQNLADAEDFYARLNTVLYLPAGMKEPEEAWAYFDDILVADEKQWAKLRDIAEFPKQYLVQRWSSAVPPAMLHPLNHRDEQEVVEYQALPVPEEISTLLEDSVYQSYFDEAARKQIQVEAEILGFSEAQLREYVQNKLDPPTRQAVEAFLESSPSARALVAGLHMEYASTTGTVPLDDFERNEDLDPRKLLLTLIRVLLIRKAHLLLQGQEYYRGSTGTDTMATMLEELLEEIMHGNEVICDVEGIEFKFMFDQKEDVLSVHHLYGQGKRPKAVFWIELRRGEEVVWEAKSIAGAVKIPLPTLQVAIREGADALALVASD